MKRRTYLKAVLAGATTGTALATAKTKAIELHVDLTVDPSKESEMLRIFRTVFRSAASQQPGFKDAKMVKLRSVIQGNGPGSANYRFVLTFDTEEQRQRWVATPVHKRLWPTIENTLTTKNYNVLLYDET
jgi:antibiotic biosynthesis monooxygenase (ABM) superfamily enzyme